jgi:cyanophycin synthetase
MPGIVRTQVDLVLPHGAAVLNADDSQVLELADYSDGEVVLYSLDVQNSAVTAHRARKGRAVAARGDGIVLLQGARETPLVKLTATNLPTMGSQAQQDVRPHVMAAVATAWALGVPVDLIRAALLRFGQSQTATAVY